MNLAEVFERFDDEYLKDGRIENRPSMRRDLCAFLLLDKLVPSGRDIVSCAEHDEIWLDVNVDDLAKAATEEDILYLVRCGIRYDSDVDSLAMFV